MTGPEGIIIPDLVIAVGSENEAKINAVKKVFEITFPGANIVLKPQSVESDVRSQPRSDEETRLGAVNRMIKAAKILPSAVFAVGLEGGVHEYDFGMFQKGWVAIGRVAVLEAHQVGCSGAVPVPWNIAMRVRAGEEIGPIMAEETGDDRLRQKLGAGGIWTNGMYSRVSEYEDAATIALGALVYNERLSEQTDCQPEESAIHLNPSN